MEGEHHTDEKKTLLNSTVMNETQFQSKQNKIRCERFVYLLYCGRKKIHFQQQYIISLTPTV